MAASKTLNREQRIERARKAGQAAQSVDTAIRRVVESWPSLSDEQVARLRSLFAPTGGDAK